MDLEIQRVARELYKAFSGLNEEFERPQDQVGLCTMYNVLFRLTGVNRVWWTCFNDNCKLHQVVIDTLSAHTDNNRQELIHPYKTL